MTLQVVYKTQKTNFYVTLSGIIIGEFLAWFYNKKSKTGKTDLKKFIKQ